jgi:hypothetical protein
MKTGIEYIGTFNNESKEEIDVLKAHAAQFIDLIMQHGKDERRNIIAATHVEEAAMMAVKSIFS